jgi:hypothetical protein
MMAAAAAVSHRTGIVAARAFLQLAVAQAGRIQPRVINVDEHPAYPTAVEDPKRSGEPNRRCRHRRPGMSITGAVSMPFQCRFNAAVEKRHRRSEPTSAFCSQSGR